MSLLSFVIFLPIFTAVLIGLVPDRYRFIIRCLALLGTLEAAIWATVLFFQFEPGRAGIQFDELVPAISAGGINLSYHVGLDGLSVGLVLVTGLVGFAATAVSWNIERQPKLYYVLLLLMVGGAMGAFASLDLFFFYFFNELALVPTFIMIGVWGVGPRKDYAAFQITLYLTLGAFVGLIGLILLYVQSGANSLDVVQLRQHLSEHPLSPRAQALIFPCLLFGFGTLAGLWPFHSWAPLGYGCAPTATAMMHAGILKKAGLYVLLRAALPLMPEAVAVWMPILAWLCLGNLLYCGWVAMRQRDLNLLLGNSSLAHMGFAFLGIASVSVIGISGAILVMVSHALLAGLSFALTGWLRQQAGSVEMDRLAGLLRQMPFIGSVLIMAFMAGCGLPGFANFAGEITVLFGAWNSQAQHLHRWVAAAAWGGLVIGSIYMLRAIREVLHGEAPADVPAFVDARDGWRRFPCALLVGTLILFGLNPSLLSERIQPVAKEIVQAATGKKEKEKAVAAAIGRPGDVKIADGGIQLREDSR